MKQFETQYIRSNSIHKTLSKYNNYPSLLTLKTFTHNLIS